MKKYLLIAAGAAMLAACTSSEEQYDERESQEAIGFGTYVNMADTRAIEKSAFVADDEIGVSACLTSGPLNGNFTPNFMSNESVKKVAAGQWTYDNAKFWPKDASYRLSFVAVYPRIAPGIDDGNCIFPFEVNDNPDLQQEFLWSTVTDAHSKDRNGAYQNGILETPATTSVGHVMLHFRHGLSKVVFSAKAAANYGATSIVVTDIVVNNLYNYGRYVLPKTLGKGDWDLSGNQDKSYEVFSNGNLNLSYSTYKTVGSSLLMLPQPLPIDGKADDELPTVTIKYLVSYKAPAITVPEERTFKLGMATMPTGGWEQDKVYSYNFLIGHDMITFDADIKNWGGSETYTFQVE